MKKGVIRPGHVQLRVMDLEAAITHYRDNLGLILVSQRGNKAFLKGWTEVDAYSIILRESDQPGMDFMGFKVLDDSHLQNLKTDLSRFGCEVSELPAGDLPDCGPRIQFKAPTGQLFELYSQKKQTGKWGLAETNPEAWPEGLVGMKAERFDHCLFFGADLDGTVSLFTEVLGFSLSEQLIDGSVRLAAFLSCSMKAHDVAFIRQESDGALHHASFHIGSWEGVLRAADIIAMRDISLDVAPTRHGLTHGETTYFFDPSGNRNEIFSGGDYSYPDHPPVTWTADKLGKAIFYHEQQVTERFLKAST